MARGIERGTTLGGRFRIEERIGGGGMGSVYEAWDLDQGFRVAVKVLDPRLARATEFRLRFSDESRHAAEILHPHILTIHDRGEDEGWHYLAMSLVEDDLAALADRERPLALTRVWTLADQVAWALDVAHAHGLVHRDVKPENILVTPRRSADEPDHAYLCDFGIAKLEAADRSLTRTGAFLGTVNYASPEQTRSDRLDGRSDQYALACVIFDVLTGVPPFDGPSTDAVIDAHRRAPRPQVTDRRPDLPAAVAGVLARGMAVDPDERFATCRELVAELRRAARGPVLAETAPMPVSASKTAPMPVSAAESPTPAAGSDGAAATPATRAAPAATPATRAAPRGGADADAGRRAARPFPTAWAAAASTRAAGGGGRGGPRGRDRARPRARGRWRPEARPGRAGRPRRGGRLRGRRR